MWMFVLEKGFCEGTASVWHLVGLVIFWLKIVIPIIIILLAILDLGKAVMAGEEKEIKEAQKMLLKRVIYGIAIFFVTTLVLFLFGLVGQEYKEDEDKKICWLCVTKPNNEEACNEALWELE